LDQVGALLSIGGLTAVLWAVIEAPTNGWGSTQSLSAFAVGAVLLGGFLAWELHYSSPMLDIRFFENPRFTAASGAITLTFLALFGTIFLLTQYLQSVLGYSTLKAGAVLLPQAVVMMVAAPLSSNVVQKVGSKLVVAAGLGLVTVSLLLFATLQVDSSTLHIIGVAMVLGLGMANVMAPATESIMGSLPRAKAGVGSAVNDTTRQVGGAVGVAVLGSILTSHYTSHVTSALRWAVPADVLGHVRNNIGQAVSVGRQLRIDRVPYAGQVVDTAKASFVSGMHTSVFVAAGATLLAAIGVLIWLPARAPDDQRPAVIPSAPAPAGVDAGAGAGADIETVVEVA
jgi:Na+/melibiose symporter-like transporter